MGTAAAEAVASATEALLVEIVERAMHASPSEWLLVRELRVGTGRRNGGAQRLDAFALNTLPHRAMRRVCYEVKTSRADFLSELKHPLKRRIGMRYSNEFYFVTPAASPRTRSLRNVALWKLATLRLRNARTSSVDTQGSSTTIQERSAYCIIRVPAPWRDTPGPTWQLLAAMLRNQRYRLTVEPPARPAQQRLELL